MISVYVDDSGTSPEHKVAIAAAMIVPAKNLEAIENEWNEFKSEEGFTYLHAAEIATTHRKGQFAGWDNHKATRVFARARNIAKTYGVGAFSMAIPKQDFDAVVPEEWLRPGGTNHYTWAFRSLMHQLINWHKAHIGIGLYDFVIDNAVGKDRYEIEMMMDQFEEINPGCFVGKYQFRCKTDVPCLQLADLIAWSSFCLGKEIFNQEPAPQIAVDCLADFRVLEPDPWLVFLAIMQDRLKESIALDLSDTDGMKRREYWYKEWLKNFEKNKTKRPPRQKCPC